MRPGQGRVFPDMRQVEGRLEKGNLRTERPLTCEFVRLYANIFAYFEKKIFFPGVVVAGYGYATDGAL